MGWQPASGKKNLIFCLQFIGCAFIVLIVAQFRAAYKKKKTMQYLVVKRADFTATEPDAASHDNFLDALIELYSTNDSANHTIVRGTDGKFAEYMQQPKLNWIEIPF